MNRDFTDGYRLGYLTGQDVGYRHGVDDESAAWTAIMTGHAEEWRRPEHAELQARREVSHDSCRLQCGRCAQCLHADAWVRRGRRPYLGAASESLRGAA